MKTPLLVAAALLSGSCVVGAPPGFSSGDSWSFPLVAPLEENELLAPVWINDKGPYLFLIDPDSEVSHVDAAIRSEHDLYAGRGPDILDERDKMVSQGIAEVPKLRVGDKLTVSNLKVRVHNFGTYTSGGRRVRGVLGRDVIADSLIFAFDRDKGMGYLATQGHFAAPTAPAAVLKYRIHRPDSQSPRRRLLAASIDRQHSVTMHIDLGAVPSQLWSRKIEDLGLAWTGARIRLVDEAATVRTVDRGALVSELRAGDAQVERVLVVPYADMRTEDTDMDGTLGLNFFAPYNVVANWHKKTLWLTERNPDQAADAAARLQRWGGPLASCANPGCVSIAVEGVGGAAEPAPAPAPAAPAPADPVPAPAPDGQPAPTPDGQPAPVTSPDEGAPDPDTESVPAARPDEPPVPEAYTLRVTRDANAPQVAYDVLVEAVDASGKPMAMPRLLITLPANQAEVLQLDFDPNYAQAASLRVLDVSPFPRECVGTRCVWPVMPRR